MSEVLWPYLVVLLAGFVPNEAFRIAAVFLSQGIDEESELFRWIRITATTLLAAVVARLVYAPAVALEFVPLWVRVTAVAVGLVSFFLLRRSVVLGILAGEAFFITGAWWFGRS